MHVQVDHACPDYRSYRAARVKSLFNVDAGNEVHIAADLAFEAIDWKIGVVVGPSGSGKTSIGRRIFGEGAFYEDATWPDDAPIVDAIAPDGDFDAVTGALASVGLGDVPAWLRPYAVLSNGEKFRADLARILAEVPAEVVIDEFSSVVDRQIARIGAAAFAKAWRRTSGQAVLLSCHYDILEWVEPDWVYDTSTGEWSDTRGSLHRPKLDVMVRPAPITVWPAFAPHHYLKDAGTMPFSKAYVAEVDDQAVAHLAVSSKSMPNPDGGKALVEARACRLVVMPEWQGAGVGMRFLNAICAMYRCGEGHLPACTTQFHTSHPGLVAALRRDRRWRQVSAVLHGNNKQRSLDSMRRTHSLGTKVSGGFGGHFRAVQGFRYYGEAAA